MALTPTGLLAAVWMLELSTGVPRSAEEAVELEWTAPPQCPTTQEVLARVEVGPAPHPVVAHAEVSQGEAGWSLLLRIEGYGGADVRSLEGESCEALADAAALLIQVATGPQPEDDVAAESEPPVEEEPKVEPAEQEEPPAEPPRPEPAERTAAPRESEPPKIPVPLAVHARAVGFGQFGSLLPRVAAGGVGVAAGITIPWFRAEARGTYVAPRQLDDASNPGVGIRVDGWGVGASGCGVWDGVRLFVPACVGAQLGRTRAHAFGLEQSGVGRGLWAQVVADVALGVRVSPRVALMAGAEAAVSLRRPEFYVRGFPTLFRTGAAAGRAFLGLEVLLRSPGVRGSRG